MCIPSVCVCVCLVHAHTHPHTRSGLQRVERASGLEKGGREGGERVLVSECLGNFLMLQKVNGKLEKNIDIYR